MFTLFCRQDKKRGDKNIPTADFNEINCKKVRIVKYKQYLPKSLNNHDALIINKRLLGTLVREFSLSTILFTGCNNYSEAILILQCFAAKICACELSYQEKI